MINLSSIIIKNTTIASNLNLQGSAGLHHIAISVEKIDNSYYGYAFVDGHKVGDKTLLSNWSGLTLYSITINGSRTATDVVNLDELRISNVVRWFWDDGDFERPTEPYASSSTSDYYVINATVDEALSNSSKMPVQNKVITTALATKQDTLTAGAGINIASNTISTTVPTLTWYTNNTTASITIADTSTARLVKVYLNGMLLQPTQDYTISGTTLTLPSALVATDKITIEVI